MVEISMGHSLFHATRDHDEEDDGIAAKEDNTSNTAQDELQSPHEIVHREQNLQHHVHAHRHIHQRQQSSADTNAAGVATSEVTSTVSLVQQVDVDTAGSILSTEDVPLPTSTTLPAATDASTSIDSGSASSTSIVPVPSASTVVAPSTPTSIDSPTTISQPVTGVTSTPSTTIINQFSTFTPGSNSSSRSSALSIGSGSISSSITSNSTSSSSTYFSSSFSSTWTSRFSSDFSFSTTSSFASSFTATSFISSTQSSSSTSTSSASSSIDSFSQSATGSGSGVVGIVPTGSSASSAATASSTSGADNSTSITNAPTATVIAGVFGGIAGVGLILVFLLFLVKWHKRRLAANQALPGSSDGNARSLGPPDNEPPSQPMSERARFAIPAGLANLGSFKPNRASRQTMRTVSSTAGSERGFVRVGGRKIRSVLESGGDGFGDPPLSINVDGASFYQDNHGIYGGHGGSPISPPAIGRQESGIPNLRPSPARTPIIEHTASFSELNLDQPPPRPDGGGLNRPSLDGSQAGSHTSRFTEDV